MLNKNRQQRPAAREVALANAGWLGIPEPDPSFLGAALVSKESSQESLVSLARSEDRGRTSSRGSCSTRTDGSPSSTASLGISRFFKSRRKSHEISKSDSIKSAEVPSPVKDKRRSRKSSLGGQGLLNQVKRTLSISSLNMQSKITGG
jgi:hypothetical protein